MTGRAYQAELRKLTDAQLTARLQDLIDRADDDELTREGREYLRNLEWETRTEIGGRAEERQLRLLFGEFSSLARTDLSFEDRHGDEWDTVDEAVILVDDTEADETTLLQCFKTDWDYCTETGGSFRWTPLSFGPIREAAVEARHA